MDSLRKSASSLTSFFTPLETAVTGGRNGYGAKLANIFSTHFRVETCDMKNGKTYSQDFYNNMSDRAEPVIKPCKKGKDYTKISFTPDLARFGMDVSFF